MASGILIVLHAVINLRSVNNKMTKFARSYLTVGNLVVLLLALGILIVGTFFDPQQIK